MDYNFYADLLNKFSQLTTWVQAISIFGLATVVLGAFYFTKEILAVLVSPLNRKKIENKPTEKIE